MTAGPSACAEAYAAGVATRSDERGHRFLGTVTAAAPVIRLRT
ncbi:hypothetical protein [Streptomyces sp. NPDC002287]